MAVQEKTFEAIRTGEFKAKWKTWMEKSLKEAYKHLRSTQERYKRNYGKRFRKNDETIKVGDYVLLPTEKKEDKD